MSDVDLNSQECLDLVNSIADTVIQSNQARYQNDGLDLYLIKNRPLINTAVRLAASSIMYHNIDEESINDIKKYAHICFWLLRLQPVSYITDLPVGAAIRSKMPSSLMARRVIELPDPGRHVPVNVEASLIIFLVLGCLQKLSSDETNKKLPSILRSKYFQQVLHSLRMHNYSSRSMAMFLEGLFKESILDC